MELVCVVYYNGQAYADYLKERGISCKIIEGSKVLINLSLIPRKASEQDNRLLYLLPTDELAEHQWDLRIQETEEGGRNGTSGFARIVCSPHGHTLQPFYIPAPINTVPNGHHAYFSISKELATVVYEFKFKDGRLTEKSAVTRHKIERNVPRGLAWINSTQVTESMYLYEKALIAAQEKANCENCTEMYYSLPIKARERSDFKK